MTDCLIEDIRDIKNDLKRRQQADTDGRVADAIKRTADAAKAVNEANLHKRKDRAALLAREAQRLQNAKTQAEIDAIRTDAEARRLQAIAEAKARVIEAVSKLKQEGGTLFLSQENLQQMLDVSVAAPATKD